MPGPERSTGMLYVQDGHKDLAAHGIRYRVENVVTWTSVECRDKFFSCCIKALGVLKEV
jgi:hypothetical protein